MDEKPDIRKLTERNLDELSELTGRPRRVLEQELATANAHGRDVMLLVNHPLVFPRQRRAARDACDYDSHWSDATGWIYLCRVHGKPSWHSITEFPSAPCIAIEPKPDDV